MRLFLLSAVAALATLASAQTPEGFTPAVTAKLEVTFGSKSVTPGLSLTKAETARIPTIGSSAKLNGTYLLFVIGELPGAPTSPTGPTDVRFANQEPYRP